ncbi:metalloregulator ArsR/SmtB family transcription factor [Streptomyces sp. NPDC093272]|uniref:ArsR/SmtB family transcription factor n=1 Tax=Streptomyces sp. NPDC093272 TaxID=3154981 RepID=UPI003416370E
MCVEDADGECDGTCLPLSAADMVWWSNVFKTLGDPVRLKLLMRLAEQQGRETAVHELGHVGVSLPTVSHHLKRLRVIGLIESRREGRVVYYRMGLQVRSALLQILHQRSQVKADA